jgi:hypothetical protein
VLSDCTSPFSAFYSWSVCCSESTEFKELEIVALRHELTGGLYGAIFDGVCRDSHGRDGPGTDRLSGSTPDSGGLLLLRYADGYAGDDGRRQCLGPRNHRYRMSVGVSRK